MNDHELLEGIRLKNEDSYEALVDKYVRYVAAVAAKVAGQRLNCHDIEEICSDTFIKIWVNSEKVVLKGESFKAYLAISARNNTLNAIRNKQRKLEDELDEEAFTYDSAEAFVLLKQEQQRINELVAELPEPDREIMIRRYFYLERVKDIAGKVGINEKAVSARIARSKDKLKSLLTEKGILREANGQIR